MNGQEFYFTLKMAISGDTKAIERILKCYSKMIDQHSYLNGKLDEDLRQYLMIHIVKNISKFNIEK